MSCLSAIILAELPKRFWTGFLCLQHVVCQSTVFHFVHQPMILFNLFWQENKKQIDFAQDLWSISALCFSVSKFSLKCCVTKVFSSLMESCCFYHAALHLRWLLVIHTVCSSLFPGSVVISADIFLWYILIFSFGAFLRLLFVVFISLEFLWLALSFPFLFGGSGSFKPPDGLSGGVGDVAWVCHCFLLAMLPILSPSSVFSFSQILYFLSPVLEKK